MNAKKIIASLLVPFGFVASVAALPDCFKPKDINTCERVPIGPDFDCVVAASNNGCIHNGNL